MSRIKQEQEKKQNRLESKTGFLPMTDAIMHAHDSVQSYHFTNEVNLINLIVLGMRAKAYKEKYEVKNVRDALKADQLAEINMLQIINTALIKMGWNYASRKEELHRCYENGLCVPNQTRFLGAS